MNQAVQTTAGAQASLVFDESNRVTLAGDTTVIVREPRENVRQVLELSKGEIWGRFTAAGQKFALIFDHASRELTGTTTEFDLVSGERALLLLPESFKGSSQATPTAVLRVFRGSVSVRGNESTTSVKRGEWAVFDAAGGAITGQQSGESFQLLRIDSSERFKDQLHWLNTESYPLRAENNVLELERQLRDIARTLLDYRTENVVRNADREIEAFEKQVSADIAAARARIAAGTPRDENELPPFGPLRMTDPQLASGGEFILGAIANWRKRLNTYPTLGDAARTLHSRVQSLKLQMTDLDGRRAQALVRLEEIAKLDKALALQDEAIKLLMESAHYDPKGEKRAGIDAEIKALREITHKATEAKGKIELLRLKLGAQEDKLDELKRKRVPLQTRLDAAKKSQDEIKAKQAANTYTEENLANLRVQLKVAETVDELRDVEVASSSENAAQTAKERAEFQIADTAAADALEKGKLKHSAANDALLDAVLRREAARRSLKTAGEEVVRLEAALDKLPEEQRATSDIKTQLDAAKVAAATRKTEQAGAVEAALDAQKSLEKASAKVATLETAAKDAHEMFKFAVTCDENAQAELKAAESRAKESESQLKQAQADLAAMEQAKRDWELLLKQWGEAAVEYEKALWDVEDNDLAQGKLAAEAQPVRDDLDAQLKIVADSENAKTQIDALKLERDKSQAVDDDIKRRQQSRELLIKDREAIAQSQLVKDREKMDEEFRILSVEHDAFDYTRARALEEDRQLLLKQKQALELYAKASDDATVRAVSLLSSFCAPYKGFETGETEAAAIASRSRIMESLWRLYYSSEGADAPDGSGPQCYYVIARSGAPSDVMRALDERWRTALAEIMGRPRFELASALKVQDLVPLKK